MKSLSEIKSVLEKNKTNLFYAYPIKSMAIFGSFARNESHENSDLDIVVEFNGKIGLRFIDLANELETMMGLKVDLVSKNAIKKRYFQLIKEDLIYV